MKACPRCQSIDSLLTDGEGVVCLLCGYRPSDISRLPLAPRGELAGIRVKRVVA